MKEEKQLIKWIEEMYHKYKATLFIEKYHLKCRVPKKDEDYYLASKFNYPYLDLTIIYSDEFLKEWQKDKKDAERRIVHEFCHAITDPFYSVVINWPTKTQIENEREILNDHIAQIVNKHFTKLSK
jgi:hypothetical protein